MTRKGHKEGIFSCLSRKRNLPSGLGISPRDGPMEEGQRSWRRHHGRQATKLAPLAEKMEPTCGFKPQWLVPSE